MYTCFRLEPSRQDGCCSPIRRFDSEFLMPTTRHVALLIEASRTYARGLVRGVARYNREHGKWSIYFKPHGLDDPPPTWLKDWKGDGILARIGNRRTADAVLQTGLPVVELRRAIPDLGLPTIGPDHCAVAQLAAEHLLERGFRHFGYCGLFPGVHPPMDEAREHFKGLIQDAGFQCGVFQARRRGEAWEQQQERIAQWVDSLPKPLGVMACNDDRGLQVLDACRRAGAAVPDEVAVIGAGNDECLCDVALPPLSSVDLLPQRVGYEAAAMLDRIMDGMELPTQQILVEPDGVVARQSTDVLATDDQAVVRAISFIRQHACDQIKVADVLAHAKLSRTALEPRLKRVVGRTIYQEIRRNQIEQVKQLLVTTDLPTKQIARQCGFNYVEYMARVFRRATDRTPAQYRKQAQK